MSCAKRRTMAGEGLEEEGGLEGQASEKESGGLREEQRVGRKRERQIGSFRPQRSGFNGQMRKVKCGVRSEKLGGRVLAVWAASWTVV